MTEEQNNLDPAEQSKDESSSDPEANDRLTDETVETPQKSKDTLQVESIPQGSIIFRQSHLSWLIPSSIWIIGLVVVDLQIGLLGGLGILLAPLIAAPRYLRWRQTVYHLSNDSLYLTMAGLPIIQKSKIYQVKFDTIAKDEDGKVQMGIRHGFFGKTLGYGEVNIVFDDKRVAKLSYISEYQSFIDYITERTEQ
ncbi:MAG: hypothetical protein DK303_001476 [Chloroflexi bacterium]|jgi:hypothetical protein|nr:MAG: hypothetical protein DK303_001476 [Chloroflexota bacterium]